MRAVLPALLLVQLPVLSVVGCTRSAKSSRPAIDRGAPEKFTVTPDNTRFSIPPLAAQTASTAAAHTAEVSEAATEPVKLMVLGGSAHKLYLGCLSCGMSEPESIFNEFGSYGSPYSPFSIWNRGSSYGSATSNLSPLNPRASTPPVIVDQNGRFHGYLTVNAHRPQAFRNDRVELLLKRLQSR